MDVETRQISPDTGSDRQKHWNRPRSRTRTRLGDAIRCRATRALRGPRWFERRRQEEGPHEDEEAFEEQVADVESADKDRNITVLQGIEAEITEDGLEIPESWYDLRRAVEDTSPVFPVRWEDP